MKNCHSLAKNDAKLENFSEIASHVNRNSTNFGKKVDVNCLMKTVFTSKIDYRALNMT